MQRKIRMGMVGGGQGAFIGPIHLMAAQLDNQIELVCGAFSSDPAKSKESGKAYFLPENRTYPSYEEMFKAEAELPEGDRMDFVTIVTPNHMHFPVQKRALESGFNIMSMGIWYEAIMRWVGEATRVIAVGKTLYNNNVWLSIKLL